MESNFICHLAVEQFSKCAESCSVYLSVCLSVRHTFLAPFVCVARSLTPTAAFEFLSGWASCLLPIPTGSLQERVSFRVTEWTRPYRADRAGTNVHLPTWLKPRPKHFRPASNYGLLRNCINI